MSGSLRPGAAMAASYLTGAAHILLEYLAPQAAPAGDPWRFARRSATVTAGGGSMRFERAVPVPPMCLFTGRSESDAAISSRGRVGRLLDLCGAGDISPGRGS